MADPPSNNNNNNNNTTAIDNNTNNTNSNITNNTGWSWNSTSDNATNNTNAINASNNTNQQKADATWSFGSSDNNNSTNITSGAWSFGTNNNNNNNNNDTSNNTNNNSSWSFNTTNDTNSNTNNNSNPDASQSTGFNWGTDNNNNTNANTNTNTNSFSFSNNNNNNTSNTFSWGSNSNTTQTQSNTGNNTSNTSAFSWGIDQLSNDNVAIDDDNNNTNFTTQTQSNSWGSGQQRPLIQDEQNDDNKNDNDNDDEEEEEEIYISPAGIDNPNNDYVIADPPNDTITSMYFSQKNNSTEFILTTWDKQVRYYRTLDDVIVKDDKDDDQKTKSSVKNTVKLQSLISTKSHDLPVLDSCFNGNDPNKVYSVGCDRVIKVWDLQKDIFNTMHFKPTSSTSSTLSNDNQVGKVNKNEPVISNITDDDDKDKVVIKTPNKNDKNDKNDNDDNKDDKDKDKIKDGIDLSLYCNPHNISSYIRIKIIKQIKEWHPTIEINLCNKIFSELKENELQKHLNDLILFRIKVDEYALLTIKDDIKKGKKHKDDNKINKRIKYLHHSSPIRSISYISENNVIITGSWDKKLKYWDSRASICCGSIDIGHKIYCMSSLTPILTIGLSNKHIQLYDLRNPSQCIINKTTPLKHQLRCIDIFPSKDGFAVASIEGRCAVEMIDNKEAKKKNFSFKCHRHASKDKNDNKDNDDNDNNNNNNNNNINKNQQDVYGVNSLIFHPNGTLITGGSDGEINFWDKQQRSRLKCTQRMKLPIVTTCFNYNSNILAYSTSYDWSRGYQGFDKDNHKPQIYLHKIKQNEIDRNASNNNNNSNNTSTGTSFGSQQY